jgi:hypothetical protein
MSMKLYVGNLLITHVDAPLKTQVLEAAIDQFSELIDGRGAIGEQVKPGRSIFDNLDRAIVNPVINEMGSDAQFLGQLRNGQESFNAARMRLIPLAHNVVLEANLSDRARQD